MNLKAVRNFDPKLVWLTGGSRGIGSAIKQELEDDQLEVVSLSSSDFDLGDYKDRHEWLSSQTVMPGILILNAGINEPEDFLIQKDETFDVVLEINLFANRDILRTVLPSMQLNKYGKIVAVSSLYASRARNGRSAYSASKAGLEALIRSVAIEFGKDGIVANSIAPGFVDTDLTRKNNSNAKIKEIEEKIPLGRLAEPREIASLVKYLISNENSYLTGQTIFIDGGVSLI